MCKFLQQIGDLRAASVAQQQHIYAALRPNLVCWQEDLFWSLSALQRSLACLPRMSAVLCRRMTSGTCSCPSAPSSAWRWCATPQGPLRCAAGVPVGAARLQHRMSKQLACPAFVGCLRLLAAGMHSTLGCWCFLQQQCASMQPTESSAASPDSSFAGHAANT